MTTTLILVRHGKPDTGDGSNRTDPPLSSEGDRSLQKLAQFLGTKGYKPDRILCSPLKRAKQSAEAIARVTPSLIEESEALGGNFDQEALLEKLPNPNEDRTIYFVGHDPTLTLFAHNLVGEKILPTGLSKSGCVIIAFDSTIAVGKGRKIAYHHPDRL